jgi:glyoxylase-like metal-dependent hydrolase (beta-lactamase superfamily II)
LGLPAQAFFFAPTFAPVVRVEVFTFNPFAENTYVLSDETGECIIIDPGCYNRQEQNVLKGYIESEGLKPVRLLNTHCHIDHVLGNAFVAQQWRLQAELNFMEIPLLRAVGEYGPLYGIHCDPTPEPFALLNEGESIRFGHSELQVIHTPGHSPGSLCFVYPPGKFIISGDVLFQMSIGRTDLAGGDYDTLLASIRNKLFTLPDHFRVYPGHGPHTTIGYEKRNNPFVRE